MLVFGTRNALGTSGSNGAFISGSPVSDRAPCGVPWYAMARLITLCLLGLPVSLKYCLASFHALSTASPPPVVKNTRLRSPGAYDASRSARSIAVGWANDHSGKKASSLACLAAASASSVRPCPTCTTNSPDSPSR